MKRQNKFIFYALLLGFGLGVIATSLLNLMYPTVTYKTYTEGEIKEMAQELGMVEIQSQAPLKEEDNEDQRDLNEENEAPKSQKYDEAIEASEKITFRIEKGKSSQVVIEHLFSEGIIEDKEAFWQAIVDKKAETKLKYGQYEITKGIDYDTLVDILSGIKKEEEND